MLLNVYYVHILNAKVVFFNEDITPPPPIKKNNEMPPKKVRREYRSLNFKINFAPNIKNTL